MKKMIRTYVVIDFVSHQDYVVLLSDFRRDPSPSMPSLLSSLRRTEAVLRERYVLVPLNKSHVPRRRIQGVHVRDQGQGILARVVFDWVAVRR